jgi:glutathione S-transferase
MSIVLHHHPYSRAATVVWTLEEVGVPYALRFVDIKAGEQKSPDFVAMSLMGKLPALTDGDTVVSEVAAIGLYLAGRYAPGRLASTFDDPARAPYFRWSLFAPSVIEPGSMARRGSWDVNTGAAGWGSYDAMLATMEHALRGRAFLLGDTFSMADVIFGGTLRYMLAFKMIDAREPFTTYAARLGERDALKRAEAINARVGAEHGLGR